LRTDHSASQLLYMPEKNANTSEPERDLLREILTNSPAMMLVRHAMRRDRQGASHIRPHEQLIYVLSGRIGMSVGRRSL
jgi:quercetin dioxygenase-like cupin family protein